MKTGTVIALVGGVALAGGAAYYFLVARKKVTTARELGAAVQTSGSKAVAQMLPAPGTPGAAPTPQSQSISSQISGAAASYGNKLFPGAGTIGVGIANKVAGPVKSALSKLKFW